jgi:hypothetical protein
MRNTIIIYLLLSIFSFGSAEPSSMIVELQPLLLQKIEELGSPDLTKRTSAINSIKEARKELSAAIMGEISSLDEEQERSYLGRMHLLCGAAAIYRIDDALPQLIERINFSLDPSTYPGGLRLTTASYYPFASALVEIGGNKLTPLLLNKISKTEDEELWRLCAWVLSEHLGRSVAVIAIKEHAKSARSSEVKYRFEKVITLLNSREGLLLHPRNYK